MYAHRGRTTAPRPRRRVRVPRSHASSPPLHAAAAALANNDDNNKDNVVVVVVGNDNDDDDDVYVRFDLAAHDNDDEDDNNNDDDATPVPHTTHAHAAASLTRTLNDTIGRTTLTAHAAEQLVRTAAAAAAAATASVTHNDDDIHGGAHDTYAQTRLPAAQQQQPPLSSGAHMTTTAAAAAHGLSQPPLLPLSLPPLSSFVSNSDGSLRSTMRSGLLDLKLTLRLHQTMQQQQRHQEQQRQQEQHDVTDQKAQRTATTTTATTTATTDDAKAHDALTSAAVSAAAERTRAMLHGLLLQRQRTQTTTTTPTVARRNAPSHRLSRSECDAAGDEATPSTLTFAQLQERIAVPLFMRRSSRALSLCSRQSVCCSRSSNGSRACARRQRPHVIAATTAAQHDTMTARERMQRYVSYLHDAPPPAATSSRRRPRRAGDAPPLQHAMCARRVRTMLPPIQQQQQQQTEGVVVRGAMRRMQQLLQAHTQHGTPQQKLLHDIRQWCDRTLVDVSCARRAIRSAAPRREAATRAAASDCNDDDSDDSDNDDDPCEAHERVMQRALLQRRGSSSDSSCDGDDDDDDDAATHRTSAPQAHVACADGVSAHRALCMRFDTWGSAARHSRRQQPHQQQVDAQPLSHAEAALLQLAMRVRDDAVVHDDDDDDDDDENDEEEEDEAQRQSRDGADTTTWLSACAAVYLRDSPCFVDMTTLRRVHDLVSAARTADDDDDDVATTTTTTVACLPLCLVFASSSSSSVTAHVDAAELVQQLSRTHADGDASSCCHHDTVRRYVARAHRQQPQHASLGMSAATTQTTTATTTTAVVSSSLLPPRLVAVALDMRAVVQHSRWRCNALWRSAADAYASMLRAAGDAADTTSPHAVTTTTTRRTAASDADDDNAVSRALRQHTVVVRAPRVREAGYGAADVPRAHTRARAAVARVQTTLVPALHRLRDAYARACVRVVALDNDGSDSRAAASPSSSSLLLRQWCAVREVLAIETAYARTLRRVARAARRVATYNAHVDAYMAYKAQQQRVWGAAYVSALRVSYVLCKLLAQHGLQHLPAHYIPLLRPVAQFVGCHGGQHELRARLPQLLIALDERAKRVRLHLEAMTWPGDAYTLLDDAAAAAAAETTCAAHDGGDAACVLSCLASEDDVRYARRTRLPQPLPRLPALTSSSSS